MTFRRKMTLQIGAMIGGLLVVIAAAFWGLNGLRTDFGVASSGYRSLRDVYEIASHIANAKTFLSSGDRPLASMEMDRAIARAEIYRQSRTDPFADLLKASILKASGEVREYQRPPRNALDALDGVLGEVAHHSGEVQRIIGDHETAANAKWRTALWLLAIVSSIIAVGSILLGIRQYCGVVRPLYALRAAADRYAAGALSDRIDSSLLTRSGSEFQALAKDFNRMAGELETLYRDLERKVADKSHELVRSERLASVGFLAAGVAHEINNPLSIITGYGERALDQLHGETNPSVVKALRIMCEEAYRCKEITDRLLTLARPGQGDRKPLNVASLAREVILLVEGLPAARSSLVRLLVSADASDATILAVEGEIKQVLLNLLLNALDAVQAGGEVKVEVTADPQTARITVTDNGRGMSADTLSRIFEPFFTDKRGVRTAGTGLGLSISHAIVEGHGGRLYASSTGPLLGSRFAIELPLAGTVVS